MKIRPLILLLIASISLIWQSGCSSSNTASGTGVGNPGKTTVSFVTRSSIDETATDSFTVTTSDSLLFTITEAYINAEEIYFIHNNGSTLREGPFKFNAITGESEPSINFDELPDYMYTGMDFIVEVEDNSDIYSLEIYGTFIYHSQTRNFTIKSTIKGNHRDNYIIEGGPTKLDHSAHNVFKVDLEVEQWLNNFQIKDSLDNQTIELDTNGDLVIDNTTDWKAAKEIAKDIKKNIFKSGKLTVIQK